MWLCFMLDLCMLRMQVEQVRVNKAKARSMKSRVEALMRFLAVGFGWRLCAILRLLCVDCKVQPDSPFTAAVHRL